VIRSPAVAVLALLAAACTTPPLRPLAPADLPDRWQAQGRLAVRAGDEAWHGTFAWQQEADRTRITLAGPLGQGSVSLREDAAGALLETGEGETVQGTDTEALLEQRLGWTLPVRGLRYWITGRADPGRPATWRRDPPPGAIALEQDGWTIACDRFTAVDGGRVPQRVVLERTDLRVRLVVDRWRLGAAADGG
jgi:outer membrane lipoprotein LolB